MLNVEVKGKQGSKDNSCASTRTLRVGESEYNDEHWFDLMDEYGRNLGYIYVNDDDALKIANTLLKQIGTGIKVGYEEILETKVVGKKWVIK